MVYWGIVTITHNVTAAQGNKTTIITAFSTIRNYCCTPSVNYMQEHLGWKPVSVWHPLKGDHCGFIHICKHFCEEDKGQCCWERSDKWTCEPPLSDGEATVTVRPSPITHRGNSIPAKDHKRSLPGLTGGVHTQNTNSTFLWTLWWD